MADIAPYKVPGIGLGLDFLPIVGWACLTCTFARNCSYNLEISLAEWIYSIIIHRKQFILHL